MKQIIYSNEFETNDELYHFLEKNKKKVQTIIITEEEKQVVDKDFILIIRTRHPEIQIIYVLNDYQTEKEDFLLNWMVFDIVLENDQHQINALIQNPRSLQEFFNFRKAHGRHVNCAYCKRMREGKWID